ncbi:hypothetical protein M0804_010292 [Polistes exclamans]|nr:hypothetical protein M0804_010292 [Polistes exclamans]
METIRQCNDYDYDDDDDDDDDALYGASYPWVVSHAAGRLTQASFSSFSVRLDPSAELKNYIRPLRLSLRLRLRLWSSSFEGRKAERVREREKGKDGGGGGGSCGDVGRRRRRGGGGERGCQEDGKTSFERADGQPRGAKLCELFGSYFIQTDRRMDG